MPLLNLYYFMIVKYGDQNYYMYLIRHFDKSTIIELILKLIL